jgi:multidrug efflux pump subunit AcrA (membrane-fusion protein)
MRTRTYPIEIDLEDSEEMLRPGMMMRVEIVLEQRGSAVLVGRSSVLDEPDSRVFVISDEVAHLRKVKTGLVVGDQIEIQSGLSAGDLVVSLGHQKLIDGSTVRIYDMPELPEPTQDSPAASAAANTGVGGGSN